jgi:hypothetical protein
MSTAVSKLPRRVAVERGIYHQGNGKYAVCLMVAGKPHFRTIGYDLGAARRERAALIEAARRGALAISPQLRFATVAGRWLARFEERVAAGERRERTLEAHRYHLDRHLLARGGAGGRAVRIAARGGTAHGAARGGPPRRRLPPNRGGA